MTESVISLSELKSDASRLLREMQDGSETLVVTQNGRARAILEDYDTYRRRQEALVMLKLMVQGESDVQQGEMTTQEDVFSTVRQRLKVKDPATG
jgi:prevent-host-death family protein